MRPGRTARPCDGSSASPPDAIVFGIVGSLNWSDRAGDRYGIKLVRAITRRVARRRARRPRRRWQRSGLDWRPKRDRPGITCSPHGSRPARAARAVLRGDGHREHAPERRRRRGVSLHDEAQRIPGRQACPSSRASCRIAYDLGGDWLWRLAGRHAMERRLCGGAGGADDECRHRGTCDGGVPGCPQRPAALRRGSCSANARRRSQATCWSGMRLQAQR